MFESGYLRLAHTSKVWQTVKETLGNSSFEVVVSLLRQGERTDNFGKIWRSTIFLLKLVFFASQRPTLHLLLPSKYLIELCTPIHLFFLPRSAHFLSLVIWCETEVSEFATASPRRNSFHVKRAQGVIWSHISLDGDLFSAERPKRVSLDLRFFVLLCRRLIVRGDCLPSSLRFRFNFSARILQIGSTNWRHCFSNKLSCFLHVTNLKVTNVSTLDSGAFFRWNWQIWLQKYVCYFWSRRSKEEFCVSTSRNARKIHIFNFMRVTLLSEKVWYAAYQIALSYITRRTSSLFVDYDQIFNILALLCLNYLLLCLQNLLTL